MPLPDEPVPTVEEIDLVSEVTMLPYATVETMIAAYDTAIANAKWNRTLEALEDWPEIREEDGSTKRLGSLEFFENKTDEFELKFRNTIRLTYGQLPLLNLVGLTASTGSGTATSYAVSVISDW